MATNGNKPPRTVVPGSYTSRLKEHSEVAYYSYVLDEVPGDSTHQCDGDVMFVVDQLLISRKLFADDPKLRTFQERLPKLARTTQQLVFGDDSGIAEDDNIEIWQLLHVHGAQTHADVAEAVWKLRQFVPKGPAYNPAWVAPNHVLVSPGNMHECPWSPPEQHAAVRLPDRISPLVDVVVIDSGYLTQGPITPLVPEPVFAEWLRKHPPAAGGTPTFTWTIGDEAPAAGAPGVVIDPLDQNNDDLLDALAGHANFVAGIVAQASGHANLIVESHGATFLDLDTVTNPMFVTEAAVARSLWSHRDAPVVNVGFAFPTLPSQAVTDAQVQRGVLNAPPSWAMQVVIGWMLNDDPHGHVVVAPAGNHGCHIAQYPAALSREYPNVLGVGSIDRERRRSVFSDHGGWVSCCAVGEEVASTFITGWIDKSTEEPEPAGWPHAGTRPPKRFDTGGASWSGTSFAAPKVSGAIAELCASSGISPAEAWGQIKADGIDDPTLDMGLALPVLLPN